VGPIAGLDSLAGSEVTANNIGTTVYGVLRYRIVQPNA
jgi:hypothetical protein